MRSIRKKPYINILMTLKVIGLLLMFEGFIMLLPIIVAWIYGETEEYIPFLTSGGITFAAGFIMNVLLPNGSSDMGKREGFMLTAFVWIFFSFFGLMPFMLASCKMTIHNAFFEAMSGFTTTGATTIYDFSNLTHTVFFYRCLIQWLGGMGIILFTLAVIPMLNSSGGMQMFNAEVTGITHDKIRPRISQTAKRLWGCYTILTITMAVLLYAGPMSLFDSICHAMSTLSTGGLSTTTSFIDTWHSVYVKIILAVFMFIGSINFVLIYRMSIGDVKGIWKNETFRFYIKYILTFSAIVAVILFLQGKSTNLENGIIDPIFQVLSASSTTGYIVEGYNSWGTPILMIFFVLMVIGSCAGSTTGGIKIDRIIYMFKNIRNEIYRILHPNSIVPVTYNGKTVTPELVNKTMAFLMLYIVIIIFGSFVMTLFGTSLSDAFITAFSCISNAGLGGEVVNMQTYAIIPDGAKWVLAFIMLIGRLELFTIVVLLNVGFWRR